MPQNHVYGEPPGSPRQHSSTGAAAGGFQRSNSASFSRRPSSARAANGSGENSTTDADDDENRLSLRPQKPPLFRSQSEYASPLRDDAEHTDNEADFEWGARHGFEDHYQSEDIISQLANVSCSLLHLPFPFSVSLVWDRGSGEAIGQLDVSCQCCERGGGRPGHQVQVC